ncbi:MAG: hypothetical protein ACOYM3_23660 [Terrimicrobiaceae bacterium]
MDTLVLVPVAALVLVSSVRFSGHRIPAWPCVLAAGGVLALFLCLRAMVPDEQVFIGSDAARRVRAQVRDLQKKPNWWEKDVLIVEGSSIATYGIDNREVEAALAARGWDPVVLEFALPAANHFERTFLIEAFFRSLPRADRDKIRAARVVLLKEVFDLYDRNPLCLFDKEEYQERAKVYMNPSNALQSWKAYAASLPQSMPFGERASDLFLSGVLIGERLLMNRFGAGALSDMKPVSWKKRTQAFHALSGTTPGFSYDAAVNSINDTSDLESTLPWTGFPPGWLACFRHEKQTLGDDVDAVAFFAMPALEPKRLSYQMGFSKGLPDGATMIGPPTSSQLQPFLKKGYWFDRAHPTGPGATEFSRWLAGELLLRRSRLQVGGWGEFQGL